MARVQVLFGAAVRRHRDGQKLTQEVVAERADIHPNYLGSVERGERNVSLFNVWRIAKGLGLTMAQLVDDLPAPTTKLVSVPPQPADEERA